jgi:GT2 family glycosyltransferase
MIAVVILNYNGKKYLEQFLPSVLATSYAHFSVVVADNASTDDSVAFLQTQYPQIRLIQLAKNFGFAQGYNEALQQVQAKYYVLLNSDVEVTAGWLQPMVDYLEKNPHVAAAQPKLLAQKSKTFFEYAGASGGFLDAYGYPFSRGRVFDVCEQDEGQYDDVVPIFWASGAAMLVRASLYHAAGGLDPYFFAHQEEIDLCWRLQLMGHQIVAVPQSVVYHVGGGTLPKGNSLKTYLNYRNNLIMLYKNLPWSQKWWKMPFRMNLDALSAWKNLLAGDAGYWWAVARAHLGFFGWLLAHQRQSPKPTTTNKKIPTIFAGNIVWAYFVQGKQKFSTIVK